METETCICGKSKVVFRVVGEDLWEAELFNCEQKEDKKGIIDYFCKSCGYCITFSDAFMMVK